MEKISSKIEISALMSVYTKKLTFLEEAVRRINAQTHEVRLSSKTVRWTPESYRKFWINWQHSSSIHQRCPLEQNRGQRRMVSYSTIWRHYRMDRWYWCRRLLRTTVWLMGKGKLGLAAGGHIAEFIDQPDEIVSYHVRLRGSSLPHVRRSAFYMTVMFKKYCFKAGNQILFIREDE